MATRHQALGLAAMAARNGTDARPARQPAAQAVSDTDWMLDGECTRHDPALFQPIGESPVFAGQIAEAKAICARCPVEALCGEYALETRQSSGVWGGMTERDREQELRRRSRQRSRAAA